jgi:hypothetical protein
MIQPAAQPESVMLFRIDAGCISDPIPFAVSTQTHPGSGAGKALSMESRLLEAISAAPAARSASRSEAADHLAILKRWYFRNRKTGELFLSDAKKELPMRRVVRAVGRVFRGERAAPDLSESAGEYWAYRAREAGLGTSGQEEEKTES